MRSVNFQYIQQAHTILYKNNMRLSNKRLRRLAYFDVYLQNFTNFDLYNRYKKVVDDYETTIYVEEALHRLVEIHYKIGLIDQSKQYANLLGYNYLSSEWYAQSYKVFNKNYKDPIKRIKKKKSNFIVGKFKSLFD